MLRTFQVKLLSL